MESLKKRIEDFFRTASWYLDYYFFLLFNLSKSRTLYSVNSIIIIDLKYIGDLIVDTPLIRAVKKRFPKSRLSFMVLPEMYEVLSGNQNIDELILYKEDNLRSLEKMSFDLGILLYPGNLMTSLFLRRIAKYRIGIRRAGFLESKGFFLDKKTKPSRLWKHKVEDNLDVVKTIGIEAEDKYLEVYTNKETDEELRKLLMKHEISKRDFIVVIHAAPQHKSHEWLDERFAQLADRLSEDKTKVVFSGAKKDIEFNNKVMELMKNKAVNLAGTTIKEFFSLINIADLVISVDTSAMHIAAAFNKPVVALFGAGDPKVWRPHSDKYEVIFKENVHTSCMKHECYLKGRRYMECMKAIEVSDVLSAVDRLRKQGSSDR